MHLHVCSCVHGAMSVFLDCSPLYIFLDRLSRDSLVSPSQHWDYRFLPPCLDFYVGVGNLNSGPHAFA